MGSGTGLKYLIECIALRQYQGYCSGKILYQGNARVNGLFKDVAYISDYLDSYFDYLTLFDYVYYGARLRMLQTTFDCRERSRNAIKLLGLDGNQKIKSLSKVELRLLSIAAELVSNPSLIVLKDPLEGLDAKGALTIMSALKLVTKRYGYDRIG